MPVEPLKTIVDRAFSQRYGVPAINIVNDLTLEAVLNGAAQARSPLIVQTSVKTVKAIGVEMLFGMWTALTKSIEAPVTLHLDHCPDREALTACLEAGWNSVLFDGSSLRLEENRRQTVEVVAEARRFGAHVEGEIESITGVEDGVGSDEVAEQATSEVALDFIRSTGVDVFAPSIGNAHGMYTREPELDGQKVSEIVGASNTPIALHGGSGLSDAQFEELIARGCAKVNISTALKETYMKSNLAFLESARERGKWDPPALFAHVADDVREMTVALCKKFGSAGKA